MTPEDFYKALKELGFNLSQKQKDQFQRYRNLLIFVLLRTKRMVAKMCENLRILS